jgi:hypothetical protein
VGAKGGANTWFTRTYLPRYYYPDHIETSISAPGEAFANFGALGVVIVGLLTGVAAGTFTRAVSGGGLVAFAASAKVAPLFFSFVRGDCYQNFSLALLVFCLCALAVRYVVGPLRIAGASGLGNR